MFGRWTWLSRSLVGVVAVLAACNDPPSERASDGDEVRTIEIAALDELAYDPSSLDAVVGETVRFVVTNEGATDHEFVVGDEATQAAHEDAMGEMDHAGMGEAEPLATLTLAPGATEEVEITFDSAADIYYACHLPGHYEGGMVGMISVS
jgi:uncharacterized cupredoxin-like copper-binding protein